MRWAVIAALLTTPSVWAQTPNELLQTFVGYQLVLFHGNGEASLKLRRSNLSRHSGTCDLAVLVNVAEWDNGKAAFRLEEIGTPYIANGPKNSCRKVTERISLEISGFANDEPSAALSDSLRQVLMTPEEYLLANGVHFDHPPGPENEEVTRTSGVVRPQLVLGVDGAYTEEARKKRLSGSVTVQIIVGSDGRVHHARVVTGIGSGLDENALKALQMWRFEPARVDDRSVARPARIEMNFRIL